MTVTFALVWPEAYPAAAPVSCVRPMPMAVSVGLMAGLTLFAGTEIVAGDTTAMVGSLLDRATTRPPAGAGVFNAIGTLICWPG